MSHLRLSSIVITDACQDTGLELEFFKMIHIKRTFVCSQVLITWLGDMVRFQGTCLIKAIASKGRSTIKCVKSKEYYLHDRLIIISSGPHILTAPVIVRLKLCLAH
jgi:hypothetical protein